MDKIIRNVNEQLWREAKARAAFEGITLRQMVEEGLKLRLGYNTKSPARHLRNHLPKKADCADCGREVLKEGKGKQRMILHHIIPEDKGGVDDPTNLVILCPHCHKKRHLKLDGATGTRVGYRKGERLDEDKSKARSDEYFEKRFGIPAP